MPKLALFDDDDEYGGTHDFKRIFSGFKSQWMRRASFKTVNASRSCAMKTLTSWVLRPWNWFCLINS